MIVMRSAAFSVGQILATVIFAAPVLLTWGRPLNARYHYIFKWVDFNLWWLKLTCNLDYVVEGIEHIPETGCVVVSNHQSAWETILFNRLFPTCAYVLKEDLFKLPFFGWALAQLEQIPIDRKAGRKALDAVSSRGRAAIEQGRKVIIFPEGTRVDPQVDVPFNVGAAYLACRTDAPVLPVAHNAGYYWPRNGFLKRPGTIRVSIGPLIAIEDHNARSLNTLVEEWIKTEQARLDAPSH